MLLLADLLTNAPPLKSLKIWGLQKRCQVGVRMGRIRHQNSEIANKNMPLHDICYEVNLECFCYIIVGIYSSKKMVINYFMFEENILLLPKVP